MERRISGPGELMAVIPAPVDGTYTIKVRASCDKIAGKEPARLAVRLDNQVVGEIKVTAPSKFPAVYTVSCKLGTGKAHLSLLMANPYLEEAPAAPAKPAGAGAAVAAKAPAKPAAGDAPPAVRSVVIDSVEVVGPPGAPPSEAQRKLFVAVPGKDLARRDAAKLIAESFARRAYRRPTQPDEIATLLKVFDLADGQDEVFSESVKLMLTAVLVSPAFLYITPDGAGSPGEIVSLGDHQLAARLSYLFWATMPDEELSTLADQGRLHEPATLEREVRRPIADPRSHALFLGFGAPWLWLDRLDELPVDEKKFGFMTKDLRKAMFDEGGMLFDTILHEDRSIVEFVDCDYTFMNAALAKLYGMDAAAKGSALTRVHLSDANRGGVLSLPGVLAVTSLPTRTSAWSSAGRWVPSKADPRAEPAARRR